MFCCGQPCCHCWCHCLTISSFCDLCASRKWLLNFFGDCIPDKFVVLVALNHGIHKFLAESRPAKELGEKANPVVRPDFDRSHLVKNLVWSAAQWLWLPADCEQISTLSYRHLLLKMAVALNALCSETKNLLNFDGSVESPSTLRAVGSRRRTEIFRGGNAQSTEIWHGKLDLYH